LNWTAYSKVGEPSKFEKKKAQKEEGHVGVLGFDM
jgi:hypothetical protein